MNQITIFNRVGKTFPTFVFILFSFLALQAVEKYPVPDFAFPQNVKENNDSILSLSLKMGDGVTAVRSAMNLCIARTLLSDSESVMYNANLMDSVALKLNGNCQSLSFLLEASILKDEYVMNQGIYDKRNLPLESEFPEDPTEWSADMYKIRILDLVNKATDGIGLQSSQSIEEISLLLSDCQTAEKIGMTVEQFICFKGVDILRTFVRERAQTIIPFFPQETINSAEGQCRQKAESLLEDLTVNAASNEIIKALAMTQRSSLLSRDEMRLYLDDCLNRMKNTEGEGVILYELCGQYDEDSKNYYKDILEWLSKYPDGFYAKQLKYTVSLIAQKRIQIDLPKVVLSNEPIDGEAMVTNSDKAYLLLFRLENSQIDKYDNLILKKFTGSYRPLQVIELTEGGEIPYSYTKHFTFNGLSQGVYVVVPAMTRVLPKGWNKSTSNASYSTFRVSDISLLTFCDGNSSNSGKVYVVKGKDQQPVEGALVKYYDSGYKKVIGTGLTKKDGSVNIPNGYFRIEATSGKNVAKGEAGFNYYPYRDKKTVKTSILTDLAVYRPGDTVNYAIVGWEQDNFESRLLQDTGIEVIMRDANYSIVATDSLYLNKEGRANGKFVIPTGRLLGNYTLTARFPEFKGLGEGSASFLVEEYKLPGFFVTLEQKQTSDEDLLTFMGKAQTYSGMPITEGKVNIRVDYSAWDWHPFGNNASYSTETETDREGIFTLELPTSGLKDTNFARGRYSITADVTSTAGETQKTLPLIFYLGKGKSISPTLPEKIEVKTDTLKFYVPVYDMAGLPIQSELKYTITNLNDSAQTLTGQFKSPNLYILSNELPSGKYSLTYETEGAEKVTVETVIWRYSDQNTPYPTPLWLPEKRYGYANNQKLIDVAFGGHEGEWMLYVISDGQKELRREWLKLEKGMTSLPVDIPEGDPTLFINIVGMWNLSGGNGTIKIEPQSALEKMEIVTESFRDQLTAGDSEHWKFSFKINDRIDADVNAFAVMSDKALNAIRDFHWNFNFNKTNVYNKINLNQIYYGRGFTYKNFSSIDRYPGPVKWMPEWQTYGYPLVSFGSMRVNGPVLYRSMKSAKMESFAVTDSMSMEETEDEASVESPVVPQATGMSENGTEKTKEVELRPVEMPLAFFKPDLKTNERGEVSLDFTVPNFNTTWQLQIAGYDENLHSATLLLDAVASKPVMVKTNLPQYLRTGDKAQISALLFNNSDLDMAIKGVLEIFNPITNETIRRLEFEPQEIEPSGNKVMTIAFDVPADCSLITVKAIGISGNFSDGEQGYLPVLPSSTPVIESTNFYASTEEETIEIKVPKLQKGANVTLKYCDNPLWEVLLALPGMSQGDNESSLSVARWLYGTLLTSHIIDSNPNIEKGLRNILESEDTTLTQSNLQKDQNLKLMALEATPWVNNASNETERIRSLGKYFDRDNVRTQTQLKIEGLKKLQQADGGWSWFEGFRSSPYITSEIIGILGYLNNSGLLDSELKEMAKKAVKYYDEWLLDSRKRFKGLNVIPTMNYLYARRLLGLDMGKQMRNIEKECLDSIVSQWRYWNLGNKSKGGLLLNKVGGYQQEVETILKSLEQFLGKKTPVDQEAQMLELFAEIDPSSNALDKIREKMFLQKETQDWGSKIMTAGVIQSLVKTSTGDLSQRTLPVILVGKDTLELSSTQLLTGNFTVTLDPMTVSGKKITIKRDKGLPAWGGVISQFIRPIKEVKSAKIDGLSVEKHVYMEDAKGKVKEVTQFKEEDKVKVVLNIDCKKDMEYVALVDSRSACLQPDAKISGMVWIDGTYAYEEIRKDRTSFFIENMPAGKYVISYDCHADRAGEYSLGIASVQCLYSPAQTAHSSGRILNVD